MKKIKTLILLSLVLLTSPIYQGCTNLDENVYDKLPVDQFGQTTDEINSLIAPIYRTLKIVFPKNYIRLTECASDMAITPTRKGGDWWNGGIYKEMRLHTWTPNNSLVGVYNNTMENITLCNKIYEMIENNDVITKKEQILAEIRGVRAFWYYMLVDCYGNVPLVTDFTDTSLPSTTPRKDVYQFVVNELNAIKDLVRDDVTSSSYGKVTKGFVYTLLAKMYLNAEVWNPTGGAKWQETVDACNQVMAMPYILEPDWKASFAVQNQNSMEIIFPCVFSTNDQGNDMHRNSLHYLAGIALGMNVIPNNGISAMPGYVKSFDPADKRLNGSFLLGPLNDPATGEVLITAHGRPLIHTADIELKYNVEDGWGQVEQEVGGRCNKWEYENGLSGHMENDFAIFRLADVYLMKAEALVRMGKDNAEATRLVNDVRKRGFDDASKLFTAVTLDDIYLERRFELAWEGYTRQDMIRFGTFLDPIPGWKGKTAEKCLIFPIPQRAMDANENLTQNPGY